MQRTRTTSARPAARRVVFMALLGALLLLALAQAVPALGAAADYTGGPQAGDYPCSMWPTTTPCTHCACPPGPVRCSTPPARP